MPVTGIDLGPLACGCAWSRVKYIVKQFPTVRNQRLFADLNKGDFEEN